MTYFASTDAASSNTNGVSKNDGRKESCTCTVRARIPTTSNSQVFLHSYLNTIDTKEHLAIVFGSGMRSTSLFKERKGETEMERMIRGAYEGELFPGRSMSSCSNTPAVDNQETCLVRIHSECYTGETAWSARCDCGDQLDQAAKLIDAHPSKGVIIYLRQEGRGIGLSEKLKAYNLQDLGNDTIQANILLQHPVDARDYRVAALMLKDLGLERIKLLTNNPEKISALEKEGIEIEERVEMIPTFWTKGQNFKEMDTYLQTKVGGMGHQLHIPPSTKEEQDEIIRQRQLFRQNEKPLFPITLASAPKTIGNNGMAENNGFLGSNGIENQNPGISNGINVHQGEPAIS